MDNGSGINQTVSFNIADEDNTGTNWDYEVHIYPADLPYGQLDPSVLNACFYYRGPQVPIFNQYQLPVDYFNGNLQESPYFSVRPNGYYTFCDKIESYRVRYEVQISYYYNSYFCSSLSSAVHLGPGSNTVWYNAYGPTTNVCTGRDGGFVATFTGELESSNANIVGYSSWIGFSPRASYGFNGTLHVTSVDVCITGIWARSQSDCPID